MFAGGYSKLYAYSGNDPVNFVDPSGLVIDSAIDAGSSALDLCSLFNDNVVGDCDNLGENLTALGLDALGLALPGVTGLGMVHRAGKLQSGPDSERESTPLSRKRTLQMHKRPNGRLIEATKSPGG